MHNVGPIKNCYVITTADGEFILRPNSLFQRIILKNTVVYHMSSEGEAQFMDYEGNITKCIPHSGSKNNEVKVTDNNGRSLVFYTSTTDDMDILTVMLRASMKDLVSVEHHKMVQGQWKVREEGTFIRRSIASEIREQELSPGRVMDLLKLNKDYDEHIEDIKRMNVDYVLDRLQLR